MGSRAVFKLYASDTIWYAFRVRTRHDVDVERGPSLDRTLSLAYSVVGLARTISNDPAGVAIRQKDSIQYKVTSKMHVALGEVGSADLSIRRLEGDHYSSVTNFSVF